MIINKTQEGDRLCLAPVGRLDASTAPRLEEELDSLADGVTDLVLDFTALDYISSAGLRVLLKTQKKMNAKGSVRVIGANDTVREVFEITGFSDILTIE